jgi:hypothetical protein
MSFKLEYESAIRIPTRMVMVEPTEVKVTLESKKKNPIKLENTIVNAPNTVCPHIVNKPSVNVLNRTPKNTKYLE